MRSLAVCREAFSPALLIFAVTRELMKKRKRMLAESKRPD
jgi:hypothetical protein